MIEIKDISGKTRLSIPINKGTKGKFTLMKEDYIILPFSVAKPVQFKLGDYVDLSGVLDESLGGKLAKIYEITDLQKPTYNTSTGGYDYNLQMNAYYWKWKNKIFKYTPEHAGNEASWSLTAALDVQLGVFLRNLKALGYTYRGTDFIFSIDDTVENKAVAMTYDNMNLLDALFSMAGEDKWNCDCWITDNVIHFGRNEFGDAVKIERGVEASSITRSESQGTYATRIYAFGSTKNIPTNYRPTDEQAVVNGVVQKRLMLPADTPYIDAYEGMSQEEAIEDVVVFDDVYPRRVGTLSDVHTRTEEVENEDGTKETITYYRYKDAGLEFKEDYILEGEELKIQFQSGKLNGMEFGVIFNPKPKDESRGDQLWEIVRNEDYGRPLPDDMMYPANGDEYILSGFDIQLVSDQYIPEAEQELKEKAQKYTEKVKKDDGTYPTTLRSSWVKEDLISRTFEFGQRINLVDDTYFENGRISRVLGWEMNLDIPWDSPVYTIGESMPYSRIGEIESDVESLTYKGQTYFGKGGVYLIKVNDSTAPSDSNTFSALRALKMFIRKDQSDGTSFLLKFGEFIDSMIAGKGAGIFPDGRGQFEKLEVRSAMIVKELIYNRWFAQEGNVTYSESGTIERIEQLEDGTYDLYLRRRWDNDITAFKEQDVDYGSVNNLNSTGEYYDSWFRVLSVMQAENKINVVLYPDEEVPGGKNYPPASGMVITRRGNAVDEERQGFWYLSSYEGCICMLDGVTKPILEESNYSIIVGKLKRLELFDNLPINYQHSYVYCRGIAIQDLMRINYQGVVVVQLNDRGFWSLEVAQSDNPYTAGKETVDTVWHYGCRWKCLVNGTTDEPRYASTGWAMCEGNPNFTIDIESENGWAFDATQLQEGVVFTTLAVTGELYNRDVTDSILDTDVSWTRDTGNVSEDNAWAIKRADAGKTLTLTVDDLGAEFGRTKMVCSFKATALLRDGQQIELAEQTITF
nr:MAG TPA: tail protein [Caudoviricetes sp.]